MMHLLKANLVLQTRSSTRCSMRTTRPRSRSVPWIPRKSKKPLKPCKKLSSAWPPMWLSLRSDQLRRYSATTEKCSARSWTRTCSSNCKPSKRKRSTPKKAVTCLWKCNCRRPVRSYHQTREETPQSSKLAAHSLKAASLALRMSQLRLRSSAKSAR